MIRQKVYQLEQAQVKMKQEFVPIALETTLLRLRRLTRWHCAQLRGRNSHPAARAGVARRPNYPLPYRRASPARRPFPGAAPGSRSRS